VALGLREARVTTSDGIHQPQRQISDPPWEEDPLLLLGPSVWYGWGRNAEGEFRSRNR
jgi:hypothetical protein